MLFPFSSNFWARFLVHMYIVDRGLEWFSSLFLFQHINKGPSHSACRRIEGDQSHFEMWDGEEWQPTLDTDDEEEQVRKGRQRTQQDQRQAQPPLTARMTSNPLPAFTESATAKMTSNPLPAFAESVTA